MKSNSSKLIGFAALLTLSATALAAPMAGGQIEKQPVNMMAVGIFLFFVLVTMGITYWASKRTRSMSDFYTAGGGISGFQNGLAIAGDYMSAGTLLGIASLAYFRGYDSLPFAVGFFIGWPVILFLLAEKLRNLGRFTVADIVSLRLNETRMRILTASGSLTVVLFYMIVQMVGAGQLIQLLFGLDYVYAVVTVGILMVVYVVFGGMVATTWVQIIKATLLLLGGTVMFLLTMAYFDFSIEGMLRSVAEFHKAGIAIVSPGMMLKDPISGDIAGRGDDVRYGWVASYSDALFYRHRCQGGTPVGVLCHWFHRVFLSDSRHDGYRCDRDRRYQSQLLRQRRCWWATDRRRQYGCHALGQCGWRKFPLGIHVGGRVCHHPRCRIRAGPGRGIRSITRSLCECIPQGQGQ
ncbi:Cation/acetate symporter ActP [Castellaniella denitrificans]